MMPKGEVENFPAPARQGTQRSRNLLTEKEKLRVRSVVNFPTAIGARAQRATPPNFEWAQALRALEQFPNATANLGAIRFLFETDRAQGIGARQLLLRTTFARQFRKARSPSILFLQPSLAHATEIDCDGLGICRG